MITASPIKHNNHKATTNASLQSTQGPVPRASVYLPAPPRRPVAAWGPLGLRLVLRVLRRVRAVPSPMSSDSAGGTQVLESARTRVNTDPLIPRHADFIPRLLPDFTRLHGPLYPRGYRGLVVLRSSRWWVIRGAWWSAS